MSASEKGHPEVVKILIEAGASRSLTKRKVQNVLSSNHVTKLLYLSKRGDGIDEVWLYS